MDNGLLIASLTTFIAVFLITCIALNWKYIKAEPKRRISAIIVLFIGTLSLQIIFNLIDQVYLVWASAFGPSFFAGYFISIFKNYYEKEQNESKIDFLDRQKDRHYGVLTCIKDVLFEFDENDDCVDKFYDMIRKYVIKNKDALTESHVKDIKMILTEMMDWYNKEWSIEFLDGI